MIDKKRILRSPAVQSVLCSLFCIIAGLLIGYIVLLFINPQGATKAITSIIKNYFWYPNSLMTKRAFGNTLVKASPLLMCSLSVLFAYKTGLFNIGSCGQYTVGICATLIFALKFHCPWFICILAAIITGGFWGSISGFLKAKYNVNEVISCIMLNWIGLYLVNTILTSVKEPTSPYTYGLASKSPESMIPTLGMGALFGKNKYVSIGIFIAVIAAIAVWIVLDKTKFGYEIKATGLNKNAARYCGMNENKNIVLTMTIAGGLAGAGAGIFYLTGFQPWEVSATVLPAVGFNGLASAFLGGLNPIGTIFSSYFIQHITDGGALVDKSVYSPQISDLISSIIIYLCGFVLFLKYFLNSILDRAEKSTGEKK